MNLNKKAAGALPGASGSRARTDTTANRSHSRREHNSNPGERQYPVHGAITGTTYVKAVRRSRHLLQKPEPSWAFDLEDMRRCRALGVKLIEVRDLETGRIYEAELDTVATKGELFDHGYGSQVRLALRHCVQSIGVGGAR